MTSPSPTYKIGKTKALYVTPFYYRDMTFQIHRPVTPDGKVTTDGWQVSKDGVPLSLLRFEQKLKALRHFREVLDQYQGDFRGLVERCKFENKVEWKLT